MGGIPVGGGFGNATGSALVWYKKELAKMLPRMSAETAEPMMKSFFMVFVIGGWSAGTAAGDVAADTETLALGSKNVTGAERRGSFS
jgi:hypothetical protein